MSNTLTFSGNIAADAERRYLPDGKAVLSFAVAMKSGYGNNEQNEWVRVSVFGKQAESSLIDYLKKGVKVTVSGECSVNRYKANDGTEKSQLQIKQLHWVDLVGGKKGDNTGQAQPAQQSQHHEQKSNGYAPSANAPHDNFNDPYGDVDF